MNSRHARLWSQTTFVAVVALAAGNLRAANPTPAAPAFEISSQLLAQESRVRAGLTPEARARVQLLEARLTPRLTPAQVDALAHGEPEASIFVVMMAYLKMVQKEARDAHRAQVNAEYEKRQKEARDGPTVWGKTSAVIGGPLVGTSIGTAIGEAPSDFRAAHARVDALAAKILSAPTPAYALAKPVKGGAAGELIKALATPTPRIR